MRLEVDGIGAHEDEPRGGKGIERFESSSVNRRLGNWMSGAYSGEVGGENECVRYKTKTAERTRTPRSKTV